MPAKAKLNFKKFGEVSYFDMQLEEEESSFFVDAAASTHLGSDFKVSPAESNFGADNQV